MINAKYIVFLAGIIFGMRNLLKDRKTKEDSKLMLHERDQKITDSSGGFIIDTTTRYQVPIMIVPPDFSDTCNYSSI